MQPHSTTPNATCEHCRRTFYRPPSLLKNVKRHFCSKSCRFEHTNTPQNVQERFWRYVRKTPNCWLWVGARDADGYGRFKIGGKGAPTPYAHRFAWVLFNGPVPTDLQVLHNCPDGDHPSCVNPAHLWLGNQQANIRDCWSKGRHQRVPGELNPVAKLTAEKVLAIRAARTAGVSGRELSERYGITEATVCDVMKRRSWRHLP